MAYWRLPSKTAIMAVDWPATHVFRNHVAWQPGQGGLLALATNNGGRLVSIGLVNKHSVEFGADMGSVEKLAWSPAGDLLATVGERAMIWNSNGTFNQELQVPPMEMYSSLIDVPKFSKDGSFIVVSYFNYQTQPYHRQFHKFDISGGGLQQSLRISVLNYYPTPVWKDELEVFCEGLINTINLWRIGQEEPLQSITCNGSISKMAFNPKRNILAFTSAYAPTTVSLWKTDTPDMVVSLLTGHDATVTEFVWQSDQSDILATFDILGGVRIWETTSNTTLHVYNLDTRYICASFSPNGRFIAVASDSLAEVEGEVNVVKFDTGDTVAVCEGNRASGGAVEWSAKGDKLAVDDYGGISKVFNVDKINFGINLKGLSMMRVAGLLEENLVNGKNEARNFLTNEIPGRLVDDVLSYLKTSPESSTSTTTTPAHTTTTPCPPPSHEHHFDLLSFVGGILVTGVAIGLLLLAYKYFGPGQVLFIFPSEKYL